jgi:hypothetical protein
MYFCADEALRSLTPLDLQCDGAADALGVAPLSSTDHVICGLGHEWRGTQRSRADRGGSRNTPTDGGPVRFDTESDDRMPSIHPRAAFAHNAALRLLTAELLPRQNRRSVRVSLPGRPMSLGLSSLGRRVLHCLPRLSPCRTRTNSVALSWDPSVFSRPMVAVGCRSRSGGWSITHDSPRIRAENGDERRD